jgi:outer membrane protein assembly factor BamB
MAQGSVISKIAPPWIVAGAVGAGIVLIAGLLLSPASAQPPAGALPTAAVGGSGRGGGLGGGRGALQFADWGTFGHDPQRTSWAFEETRIAPDSVAQMKLVWKTKLDSKPYSVYNLTPPVVVGNVPTAKGLRPVVYTQSMLDGKVFALDAETGEELWNHAFQVGMTAIPQREGGYQYQGGMLCPPGASGSPVADKTANLLYAVSPYGKLYGLDLGSGEIRYPGTQFVVPFSKVSSLILVNDVIYTTLAQGCGDARSGFYAIDVHDRNNPKLYQGLTSAGGSAGPWGHGAAFGTNGRIYGGTADGNFDPQSGTYSNALVAMSADTLKFVDYYLPVNWRVLQRRDFDMGAAAPVFFGWKNHNLVAHGAKESVLVLMDADNLGGADHQTPLYQTPRLGNDAESGLIGHGIWGGASMTRDTDGNTWVLVPVGGPPATEGPKFRFTNGTVTHGSVMAFRVVADPKTGNPVLEPEWISSDLDMPDGVVSANGVVFALSTGSNEVQRGGDAVRMSTNHPATLKAFDLETGKDLWNSGTSIESWMHFSGVAISGGTVFLVDHDANIYGFGGLPAPPRNSGRGPAGASGASGGGRGR